ncbi:MAG: DUF362 domain-containing protein [Planctomycetes bacterium]|nr:DUF362 domain-containing protein [Planctomycetota bacterium]
MHPFSVAFTPCGSYDLEVVEQALVRQIDKLGALRSLVSRGDRVLIKPNFIAPRAAELAVQTHTSVILGVARLLKDYGARPFVGDSPAWGSVEACANAQGLDEPLRHLDIDLVQLDKPRTVTIGPDQRRVGISTHALDADAIFNLPKLKSHQQMMGTFAVKNMFGCVSGKRKPYWHFAKGASQLQFAEFLIHIFEAIGPVLNLVDGVVGMDQDGPINGRPRPLHWLIGSRDPMAVERACARLIGLPSEELPMVQAAERLAYGCPSDEQLDLVDVPWSDIRCLTDFDIPTLVPVRFSLGRVLKSMIKGRLVALKNVSRK